MAKVKPEVLKRLRKERRWTQEQLATKAKLNKQTISRLERGSCNTTRQTAVETLARVLRVEPAVLTGEASLPIEQEIRPTDPKIATTVRLEASLQNAIHLVARRYGVGEWQILDVAPFLFCWAAEASLRRRRQRVSDLERACEQARSLEAQIEHLSEPSSYCEEKLAAEKRSIEARDLFASDLYSDGDFIGGGDAYRLSGYDNPFAVFLTDLAADYEEILTFKCCNWGDTFVYQVCIEEALKLVEGNRDRLHQIYTGWVALHEMPKELQESPWMEKERAEWVRAEVRAHHEKYFRSSSEVDVEQSK